MKNNQISQTLKNIASDNFSTKEPEYYLQKLRFGRNQYGYHWSYKVGNKKYSVSSKKPEDLSEEQMDFLQTFGANEAKFIVSKGCITELWLKCYNDFVKLDSDILQYKKGSESRKKHGFDGTTYFFPKNYKWDIGFTTPDVTPKYDLQNESKSFKSAPSFEDLDKLANKLIDKYTRPKAKEIPTIPLSEKKKNLESFLKNFEVQLHKIFKNIKNREINISNDGFITFSMEIEKDSQENINHNSIIFRRNHKGSRLDTIDGEAMFSYLMNPIYKHLGFSKREYPDRKHYTGMGDSGDFKYGTTRLDMKTRRKEKNNFCNLLVNKGHENYNQYGLVLREGDVECKGNQRRLTFVGVASQQMVTKNSPKMINGALKYEVGLHELESLGGFIIKVLIEVLKKDES